MQSGKVHRHPDAKARMAMFLKYARRKEKRPQNEATVGRTNHDSDAAVDTPAESEEPERRRRPR